jgi:hypothetical protein
VCVHRVYDTHMTHVRLSININTQSAEILRTIAAEREISATEAVRRAIGLLGFTEEARRNGETLYVERNGRRARVEIL